MRRTVTLTQGALANLLHGYVTANATPKTVQKKSRPICHQTDIAQARRDPARLLARAAFGEIISKLGRLRGRDLETCAQR
jgi:hypothetical protein